MRAIPSAIKTLLKSRSMIGSDGPNCRVTFLDKSSGFIESDSGWLPVNTREIRYRTDGLNVVQGNWVKRSDGLILGCYMMEQPSGNPRVMLSTVDGEENIYNADNAFEANEWVFKTMTTPGYGGSQNCRLFKKTDGKLLLFVLEQGNSNSVYPQYMEVYESVNGLGTDFTLIGEAWRNNDRGTYGYILKDDALIGTPLQLDSGRIVLSFSGIEFAGISNYGRTFNAVTYSDDGGVTWTVKKYFQYNYCIGSGSRGLAKFGNRLVTAATHDYGLGMFRFHYSDDSGETWSACAAQSASYWLYGAVFWGGSVDGENYLLMPKTVEGSSSRYKIFRPYKATSDTFPTSLQEPYSYGAIGSGSFWEGPIDDAGEMGDDGGEILFVTEDGSIAIIGVQWSRPVGLDNLWLNGVMRTAQSSTSSAESARISREISANSQRCQITIPNVNPDNLAETGFYSPESGVSSDWANQILPGKNIKVEMGYGSELIQVFKGQIDETLVNNDAGDCKISIDCRDDAWMILDKIVSDSTNYYITYSNKTVEYIVNDLLTRAGFTSITYENTGITITKKTFDRITYADAIEWCMTVSGFELLIDETGAAFFQRPNDRQPEAEDEEITLSGTTAVALTQYPIVTDSIVVWSAAGKTGIEYVKDVDYTITVGNPDTAWQIERTASSSIPDGAAVYVSYVYAAYVFKEGVDIFSLSYRYSRRDMYGKVIVTGKDSSGKPVTGTYTLPGPSSKGVTEDKILFIDDQELDTASKCQSAAEQIGADMNKKYRESQFAAVGVPWIQVGDCIQIIESSSGISEIYRVLSMNIECSPNGMFMTLRTYHYGYSPG